VSTTRNLESLINSQAASGRLSVFGTKQMLQLFALRLTVKGAS